MFNNYGNYEDSDDSDSQISFASATVSEEDNEYPIKELIADKWCPTRQKEVYLVHWEGYEIGRATWEPEESFEGDKIEIVHDYLKRKKHGLVPYFDYKQWDREREREQEEREERERKREERQERKAKKMSLQPKQQSTKKGKQKREKLIDETIRHSRRASPELAGFVVSDDSGLDEEESDKLPSMDEDSDEDVPVRKRNLRKKTKKKAPVVIISSEGSSSDGGSSDSLMAALSKAEKQKRKNKGKAKVEEKKSTKRLLQRAVPKKRPLGKSPSRSPPRVRKRPTIASSSTAKPSTTGINASPRPTQNDFFPSLSIQNAVRKKGNTERAPPAEELNLIKLGDGASVPMETEKRPQDTDINTKRNISSPQQVQKRKRSPPANEFRGSRHPGPGPRIPTHTSAGPRSQPKPERPKLSGVTIRDEPPPRKRHMSKADMDALGNIHDAGYQPDLAPPTSYVQPLPVQQEFSPVQTFARAQPAIQPTPYIHPFQSPPPFQTASFQPAFPFQAAAASFRITPPPQDMDMEPHHAETYDCEVEYGPSLNTMESMGKVKFVGFSSEFLTMLNGLQLEKLWISKSLEISYISKHFVPVSKHCC
ncbi:hypothetical protein BDD12DRAFT_507289 [Trichophaea hybrida]|nr:hypothetical protein BDD12DRAFT_507289 [Trichophaea hybrida]